LRFTHAGAVVYRIVEGNPRFLIITGKKNPRHWVLPKGHIEKKENSRKAAIREVKEETGYAAKIIRQIGASEYSSDLKKLKIKFFLMELDENTARVNAEEREARWCARDEAMSLLSFDDSKKLVTDASDYLDRRANHEDRDA
jgi:8-oxo-dGTP pyrophosphatase MutT (NUDIX family)